MKSHITIKPERAVNALVPFLLVGAAILYHWLIWPGMDGEAYAQRLPLLALPALLCLAASFIVVMRQAIPGSAFQTPGRQAIGRGALAFAIAIITGGLIVVIDFLFMYGVV